MDATDWRGRYATILEFGRKQLSESQSRQIAELGRSIFEAGAPAEEVAAAHIVCVNHLTTTGRNPLDILESTTVPLVELMRAYGMAMAAQQSVGPAAVDNVMRERQHMEVSLHESEVRYRTLFDQAADSIVLLDAHTAAIIEFNERAHQNLEYTSEEFRNLRLEDIEVAESPVGTGKSTGRVFAEGVDTFETKHRTRSGEIRDVLISARTISLGGRRCVQEIWRDITDRKQTEELARVRQQELAHVTRLGTVGEMAAGLAHEINQPLFAISNYAEGSLRKLRSGVATPEELLSAFEQMAKQAQRAGEIIRRLRNFVRRGEPKWERVCINDLIEEVARFMEGDAHAHDVRMELHLADKPCTIEADSIQIQQVLVNLLRNGMEVMRDGRSGRQTLTIRTSVVDDKEVEITVCDTGHGIATDNAEQIFDPFFTTKAGGLGMGLSISRTIVQAHDGRVWATPNPDQGTTFHVTLPIAS